MKKIKASRITYKNGKQIDRIIDGPDTELKPDPEARQPEKRTLIRNYFRVSRTDKRRAKEKKDLYYDSADLWLLFNKVGFMMFEKNQRFESTNLSIPIKVVYALLSYDDESNLLSDCSERTRFLAKFKDAFMDKTNDYSEKYKLYIMDQLTARLKETLARQSSDEEVIRKVISVDCSEVDLCFAQLLANSDVRMKYFARQL